MSLIKVTSEELHTLSSNVMSGSNSIQDQLSRMQNEVLAVVGDQLKFHGLVWDRIADVSDNFGMLGFAIIALFVVAWLVSIAVYRVRGYDRIAVSVTSDLRPSR